MLDMSLESDSVVYKSNSLTVDEGTYTAEVNLGETIRSSSVVECSVALSAVVLIVCLVVVSSAKDVTSFDIIYVETLSLSLVVTLILSVDDISVYHWADTVVWLLVTEVLLSEAVRLWNISSVVKIISDLFVTPDSSVTRIVVECSSVGTGVSVAILELFSGMYGVGLFSEAVVTCSAVCSKDSVVIVVSNGVDCDDGDEVWDIISTFRVNCPVVELWTTDDVLSSMIWLKGLSVVSISTVVPYSAVCSNDSVVTAASFGVDWGDGDEIWDISISTVNCSVVELWTTDDISSLTIWLLEWLSGVSKSIVISYSLVCSYDLVVTAASDGVDREDVDEIWDLSTSVVNCSVVKLWPTDDGSSRIIWLLEWLSVVSKSTVVSYSTVCSYDLVVTAASVEVGREDDDEIWDLSTFVVNHSVAELWTTDDVASPNIWLLEIFFVLAELTVISEITAVETPCSSDSVVFITGTSEISVWKSSVIVVVEFMAASKDTPALVTTGDRAVTSVASVDRMGSAPCVVPTEGCWVVIIFTEVCSIDVCVMVVFISVDETDTDSDVVSST